MLRIDKEVTVNAPIEQIFNYISEPSNPPEFWPSLMEIKDIQSLPNGGYSARWTYKMLGMRFEGTAEQRTKNAGAIYEKNTVCCLSSCLVLPGIKLVLS